MKSIQANFSILFAFFVILLAVHFFTTSPSSSHASLKESIPIKIVNKEAGYSVVVPEKWEIAKGEHGTDVMALAPDGDPDDLFRENMNIVSATFKFPVERDEFYSINVESLTEILDDFDLEKQEDVVIDEVPARKLIFTHTLGLMNAKVIQFLILQKDQAYVLTFTADQIDFDKYQQKFNAIANSLELKK